MDNKQELLNFVTDLKRAVRAIVRDPQADCLWLNNISQNYDLYCPQYPFLSKYIDIKIINDQTQPPIQKAEYLLMMANRLKNYLLS